MKYSRAQVQSTAHSIPEIRFEDQSITSFSGLVLHQVLFQSIGLNDKLRACVRHLASSSSYSLWRIVLILIVHLSLGWRRLRDLDYYRDDPMVQRLVGLKRLPNVSTVSRCLRQMDAEVVKKLRELSTNLVFERIEQEALPRLTLDFDGSVLTTKSRNTEGTAVGFNPKAKGQRSYYPLFGTVAQTGQVFDVFHRSGNVHDSNGAPAFIQSCFERVRERWILAVFEARIDSAHFNDQTLSWLDDNHIEFTVSVPFERFPRLKGIIERRTSWKRIDKDWSFFEYPWKPEKWTKSFRCICYRHRIKVPRKGPIQLDLFTPIDWQYEYKAVMSNKRASAGAVLGFHNGRGSQEGLFAELKSQLNMDYLPTRRLIGNQIYLQSAIIAHNINRELQMRGNRSRADVTRWGGPASHPPS
jgi:hypothetical protein